jgi:fructose-1,6-bisphosphatase I
LYGGIYFYPGDAKNPNGKLRLMYENNPLAFIVHEAGGLSSDGRRRTLDLQPQSLHERSPLFIGSRDDVLEAEAFMRGER